MPVNKSAFFEDEERWSLRYSILFLRSGIPVDAKLAEYDLALEIRSHFIYSWVDRFAGSTAYFPEINNKRRIEQTHRICLRHLRQLEHQGTLLNPIHFTG